VNRTAAAWLGGDAAIGRRLRIPDDEARTVVGIVGDIKHAGLHADEGPVVYVPYAQKPFDFLNWMGVVVRAPGALPSEASLKAATAAVDPNQPLETVRSMAEYVALEGAPYRFSALVVGSLAAAALLLALTGIYGMTTFIVGRRARELALRLALGASGTAIVLVVFRQVGTVLVAGAAAGMAACLASTRVLGAVLDSPQAGGSALPSALTAWALICLSAGIAALGPALRGAWLDPKVALQSE
jgi:hypothetical protein